MHAIFYLCIFLTGGVYTPYSPCMSTLLFTIISCLYLPALSFGTATLADALGTEISRATENYHIIPHRSVYESFIIKLKMKEHVKR